jgi:hypothetical protein
VTTLMIILLGVRDGGHASTLGPAPRATNTNPV